MLASSVKAMSVNSNTNPYAKTGRLLNSVSNPKQQSHVSIGVASVSSAKNTSSVGGASSTKSYKVTKNIFSKGTTQQNVYAKGLSNHQTTHSVSSASSMGSAKISLSSL